MSKTREEMTRAEKLEMLQDKLLDTYLDALESGDVHYRDLAPMVSLLKQNNVVEQPGDDEESIHDIIAKAVIK